MYSSSIERLYSVGMWENLIVNSGIDVNYDDDTAKLACEKINREINIKSQLLEEFNFDLLDDEVSEQNRLFFQID